MPKFNTTGSRATTGAGPISTVAAGPVHTTTATHQGGVGYVREPKSDLLLLATTSHDLTAKAFYEGGDARIERFASLIHQVAPADPDWTYRFLTWLRTKGNIRTAAVVGGVEAAIALTKAGIPGGRHMVSTVQRRADEPGEVIAYHHKFHGRALPKAVKRGTADAVTRLYTERALLKYDTAKSALRFADVLALTHATARSSAAWQGDLFAYAVSRRYGRDDEIPEQLHMIAANRSWHALAAKATKQSDLGHLLDPETLAAAGLTWENALSALGGKVDKKTLWRSVIKSGQVGLLAAIRNLRNMDEAGLSDADVQPVIDMMLDPEQVLRSRILPLQILSAYRAAPSLRWAYPLDRDLNMSLGNIPALTGRTLVLIDTSQSMNDPMSDRSDLRRWDAACAFGLALAARCDHADVVSFSDNYYGRGATKVFSRIAGESLLTSIKRFKDGGYFLNAGTDTAGALRQYYNGHDRVVILTDEQVGAFGGGYGDGYRLVPGRGRIFVGQGQGDKVTEQMPADRPLYTFNVAGYQTSHAPTDRNRLVIGGLTDHMFAIIPIVEAGRRGGWPWDLDSSIGPLPTYEQPGGARTATGPLSTADAVDGRFVDALVRVADRNGLVSVADVADAFPERSRSWVSIRLTNAASKTRPLPGLHVEQDGRSYQYRVVVTQPSTVPRGSQGGTWSASTPGGWTGRTTSGS